MKKKIFTYTLTIALLASFAVTSFAWFSNFIKLKFPVTSAETASNAYFKDGTGTNTDPYIISEPIHLYNLAWLQYIGYFNLGPVNNGSPQSYFKLEDNINMTGLTLPPIGTTQYPFLGNFDGNEKIISNLTVANAKAAAEEENLIKQHPAGVFGSSDTRSLLMEYGSEIADASKKEAGAIIGFFGVVGDYENAIEKVTTAAGANSDKFVAGNIAVKNFGIAGYTLDSGSNATTVGFVAGYVNAKVENVLVGNCTLRNEATAIGKQDENTISKHTLIGYCDTEYEETVKNTVFSIYDPNVSDKLTDINGAGQDANWGGSVAMNGLFQELATIRGTPSEPGEGIVIGDYAYKATKVISADGKSYYAVDRDTTGAAYMYANKSSDKSQYSVVYTYDKTNLDEFVWLAGGAMVTTMTCQTDEKKTVTGHYIKFGDEYLNVGLGGGTPSIELGTEESTASRWVIENGNLFVLTQGCKLYVNVLDDSIVFSYQASSPHWTFDTTNGLCYNGTYYLKLIDGNWYLREENDNAAYYYIKYNGEYLNETSEEDSPDSGSRIYNTTLSTTASTKWYISSFASDGKTYNNIYLLKDQVVYYLRGDMKLDMNVGRMIPWQKSETQVTLQGASPVLALEPKGEVTDSPWTKGPDETLNDMTFNPSSPNTTYNFEFGVANECDATYIPLQKNKDNTPTAKNTGYITSGMYNQLTSSEQIPQPNSGDVRLSAFYTNNIKTKDSVYAYINGQFTKISTSTPNNSLMKFNQSVEAYNNLLNDQSGRLYGLQFIDGMISKDSLVTVPNATINGLATNKSIKIPADCVDFRLKESGYINFFAATYYPETSCFFSLHHIIRDANTDISDIKEIKIIYTHTDPAITEKYVYEYTDGTYSVGNSKPANASTVFDTSWLTDPNLGDNLVQGNADITSDSIKDFKGEAFYFEIPVNEGEYALGSVEGKIGATLLYLDIGASMQDASMPEIDRTTIYEVFEEEVQDYTYAEGVGIMDSVDRKYEAITTNSNFSMTLGSGYGTDIKLDRTGDSVTVSSTAAAEATLNSSGGFTVNGGQATSGNVTLTSAGSSSRTVIKRVTYIDYNKTADETIKTVITLTLTDESKDGLISDGEVYTVTIVDGHGNDLSASSRIDSTGGESKFTLSHRSKEDVIKWNEILGENDSIITYQCLNADNVTSSYTYDMAAKKYTVSAKKNETEITDFTYTFTPSDNVASAEINGNDLTAEQSSP